MFKFRRPRKRPNPAQRMPMRYCTLETSTSADLFSWLQSAGRRGLGPAESPSDHSIRMASLARKYLWRERRLYVQANGHRAALSRSVQRPKGARLSDELAFIAFPTGTKTFGSLRSEPATQPHRSKRGDLPRSSRRSRHAGDLGVAQNDTLQRPPRRSR